MPDRHPEAEALIREVLGQSFTELHVKRFVIEEDIDGGATSVTCEVSGYRSDADGADAPSVIAGKGVGVVDAFFHGMQSRFAEEYPSLKTIRFASFAVDAKLDTKKEYAGTDSAAEVTIEIANSENHRFYFSSTWRSVTAAAIITTLRAMEFFINSERAFITMYHALKDAERRKRADLVARYTSTMAVLVQNTSYSEVISRMSEELGNG